MSLSATIAPHLPFLRRFSRAVSGSQESGDALVAAMLAARSGRPFGICRACRHFAADAHGPGQHYCQLLKQPLSETEADEICQEQEAA